jgi:serine/threonine protein kinase
VNIRAATQTTHLGRYHVVKRLAAGGMADVLIARTDGIEGFQRHVVIKRIHAELLEEPRYVKMFLDEARLAASLHHHNIVQVNDIGQECGEYFFAMEYVHGEDVRTLLVDASKRGEQIPLEHVITIITGAAAGLHHAHEQRGMDGTPLHIVHRDVSPANILVGYDGAVKVADFGIALAAHRAEHTQSGVLKGKVAYMSPEQCNCDPVDRRSDVFSLGIVLYELVTVRPCFAGDNDFMTMSAIVGGKLARPSTFRKGLPPALEAIIMKALARDAAARFQSADELRRALEELAAAEGLRNSATALADYMKKKFGTKALPWQTDDSDEPEIHVGELADDALVRPAPARGSTAVRVLTPTPGGVLVAAPRQRTPAPTVPLRPQTNDPDDDLAIPVDDTPARRPQMPLAAPPTRAPAQVVMAAPTPVNDEVSAATAPAPMPDTVDGGMAAAATAPDPAASRKRRLWLVGSVAAVAIAMLSLILVSSGRDKPAPTASAAEPAPARVTKPAPVAQPAKPAVVAPVEESADELRAASEEEHASPPKRSRRPAAKRDPRPAPVQKKWDPDALFPQ